jgi:hypothetical protein
MMRNAATLIERHLRGRDFNLLINLDGIAVDDLAAETQGYFNPQVALARGGRADDGDDSNANCQFAMIRRCPALSITKRRKLTVCVTGR